MGGNVFFYCLGAFYVHHAAGYELVGAPAGAVIRTLPPDAERLELGGRTLYYYEGVFYEPGRRRGEFVVVPAPIGAVVGYLPHDAVEVTVEDALHYVARGVYYAPVRREGVLSYVVVGS